MNLRLATLASLLALTAAEAADAPPGATACSGCHAGSAGVDTPATRLIGMKADDILAAMVAYRTGARPATVMDRIAKGFTEPEAAAIANWYATQPN
jgi:cytochrome c553